MHDLKIAFGEDLLIRQQNPDNIIKPWGWNIYDQAGKVFKFNHALQKDFDLLVLGGDFKPFVGRAFFLEFMDQRTSPNVRIGEVVSFLISGIFSRFLEMRKLVGLLGENARVVSDKETDYESGNDKHKAITLYEDKALTIDFVTYEWNRRYSEGNVRTIADQRYQVTDEKQVEQ